MFIVVPREYCQLHVKISTIYGHIICLLLHLWVPFYSKLPHLATHQLVCFCYSFNPSKSLRWSQEKKKKIEKWDEKMVVREMEFETRKQSRILQEGNVLKHKCEGGKSFVGHVYDIPVLYAYEFPKQFNNKTFVRKLNYILCRIEPKVFSLKKNFFNKFSNFSFSSQPPLV